MRAAVVCGALMYAKNRGLLCSSQMRTNMTHPTTRYRSGVCSSSANRVAEIRRITSAGYPDLEATGGSQPLAVRLRMLQAERAPQDPTPALQPDRLAAYPPPLP